MAKNVVSIVTRNEHRHQDSRGSDISLINIRSVRQRDDSRKAFRLPAGRREAEPAIPTQLGQQWQTAQETTTFTLVLHC